MKAKIQKNSCTWKKNACTLREIACHKMYHILKNYTVHIMYVVLIRYTLHILKYRQSLNCDCFSLPIPTICNENFGKCLKTTVQISVTVKNFLLIIQILKTKVPCIFLCIFQCHCQGRRKHIRKWDSTKYTIFCVQLFMVILLSKLGDFCCK